MPIISSDSIDNGAPITKLFGRERPIHSVLGGGKVADVLLWRKKAASSAYLMGVLLIWFLFEFAEYNFVTFLCHLTITTMLIIFIWSNGAKTFKWSPPDIPKILLEESRLYRDCALFLHKYINFIISKLLHIASGYHFKHFFLATLDLLILSMIGNYISTFNLLTIGFLCMGTLPFLYEKYEEEIDYVVYRVNLKVLKIKRMFETNVLSKIPRGPRKAKKFR